MDLREIAQWYSNFQKDYGILVKSIQGSLLLLAGWLLKKGNEKYKAGLKAGRDAESKEALTKRIDSQGNQIEDLEDRVSRVEQNLDTCQAHRGELIRPVEKLICAKMEAFEKTIDARMKGQRELAKEEKRREMVEIKNFIRDELERLLG